MSSNRTYPKELFLKELEQYKLVTDNKMKKSEFRGLIKEEIKKILLEKGIFSSSLKKIKVSGNSDLLDIIKKHQKDIFNYLWYDEGYIYKYGNP